MSVNYYALGKTTWKAIRLEDFRGARGQKLEGLDRVGPVYLETDWVYADVSRQIYGEYRFVFWPSDLLELFMHRFGEENPAGVEYWASDCISVYDEPAEGSFGWLNGNHGHPIEYVNFRDMWEIADRYVPELRLPENMRRIFGDAYDIYVQALEDSQDQHSNPHAVQSDRKSVVQRLKRIFRGGA